MVDIWRLTRTRFGHTLWDSLQNAGFVAAWMTEYVADLDDVPNPTADTEVAVEIVDPDAVAALNAPVKELQDGEMVVAGFDGGRPVGYLFCSVGATHDIVPLEQQISFDGCYLRRVFVDPKHRQRGVATALLRRACTWGSEQGTAHAYALVARDNGPSRMLFERHGFHSHRELFYLRIGSRQYRHER